MARQLRPLAARWRCRLVMVLRCILLILDVAVIVYFARYLAYMDAAQLTPWSRLAFAAAAFGIFSNVVEMASLLDALATALPRNRASVCGLIWADLVAFALGVADVIVLSGHSYPSNPPAYHFGYYEGLYPGWAHAVFVELGLMVAMSVLHGLFSCYLCCGVYKGISDRDRQTSSTQTPSRRVPRDNLPLYEVAVEPPPPPPYQHEAPQTAPNHERWKSTSNV